MAGAVSHVVTSVAGLVTDVQVTLCQPFALDGVTGEHDGTGVGPADATEQVVVVQLLPADGPEPEQVPAWTPTSAVRIGQVVVVQPLADAAALGVQDATGTLVVLLVVQTVAVQAFAEVAGEDEQVATATLDVLLGVQVVAVQLLAEDGEVGVHDDTPTLPVLFELHVVVVQLFADVGESAAHDAAGVGPVTAIGHVVVVQLLPALAAVATQLPEGVLVLLAEQVVVV